MVPKVRLRFFQILSLLLFRSSDPYGSRSPCGNQWEHKHVLVLPNLSMWDDPHIVAQVNWGQHCNLWGNNCVSVSPSIPMRLISRYLLIFARLCTADWILYEADIRSFWVYYWQKDTRPFLSNFIFQESQRWGPAVKVKELLHLFRCHFFHPRKAD